SVTLSYAQDSAKVSAFKWSASVDGYYRYNFQEPKAAPFNNYTSFTNSQNSFELGMASIKAEHTIGKVGFVADLGFGRRAEEFSYNDSRTMQVVKQAYVTYAPSSHVKFTMGKWATHIGYELLDASANRNYSMSYMFTNGPFFHTGLRSDFTFGKSGFMIGVANPTDYTTTTSTTKTLIAQFSTGTKDDKLKAYLNYQGYFGAKSSIPNASKLNQLDLVVTGTVSPKFSIAYNGTIEIVKDLEAKQSKKWWGSALYLNYDPTSTFGLTWRNEYFGDQKYGLKTVGGGANIFASTLSANFRIDNFRIIPEFRVDNASKNIFTKSDGTVAKGTESFILAAVYSF
ncbi:MAG: porin, partial [Bacteroidota bacterium]|nr:porin [Bacteroidota bacterium]